MADLTPVHLRDGTEAFVVPLLPAGREALREEHEHLSAETRFDRFLALVPMLTENLWTTSSTGWTGWTGMSPWCCSSSSRTAPSCPGSGPDVRYPDDPTAADVAVTVVDAWHGPGVATALLEVLMRHRPQGWSGS